MRGDPASIAQESRAGVEGIALGAWRELSPEEEKVMRMRLGATPPRGATLERAITAENVTLVGNNDHIEVWPTPEWNARVDEGLPRAGVLDQGLSLLVRQLR